MNYVKIPILEAAERCGLNINKRTIGYTEVEAESYLAPLSIRHDVYYDMLSYLSLSKIHKQNLLERGCAGKTALFLALECTD